MTDAPDLLAAELTAIRSLMARRHEMMAHWLAIDAVDLAEVTENLIRRIPALVGAVEAAQSHHQRDEEEIPVCKGCGLTWPCYEWMDIAMKLLGEEDRGGHG